MRLIFLALTSLLLASAPSAGAGDKIVRDFRYAADTAPALQLSNPAALTLWAGKISSVELEGSKGNGPLIPLEGSPDDFSLGAGTESFYRMSDKIAFRGKLFWRNFQGKDMGGPVFMNPDMHPVNFYESVDTTTGVKKRESYGLAGSIALNLGPKWAVGLGLDYECSDQNKIKDPRFTNVLMDLRCTAGVAFKPSDNVFLGLSLFYRDAVEQIRGGIYGTTDKQYYVLTDKGGFIGTSAALEGDNNYVSAQNLRPMVNSYYGASIQALLWKCFSNEFSYSIRKGYYGKKAESSPLFFNYSGTLAGYKGLLQIPAGNDLHRVAVELEYERLDNTENTFRYVTPEGGSTIVDYISSNNILNRQDISASLDYRWYINAGGRRPGATVGAKAEYVSRNQLTSLYPVWRKHNYTSINAGLFGQKVFTSGVMSYVVDADLFAATGFGLDKQDGVYVSGASSSLKSFDNYLGRYFEYKTKPRAGAGIGFTVARLFERGFEPYITVSDRFECLLSEPQFLAGRMRNLACITIGCNF